MARGPVLCPARGGTWLLPLVPGLSPSRGMRSIVSPGSPFPLHPEQRCEAGSLGDNSSPLAACRGEGESEVGKDDGQGESQESQGGHVRTSSQNTQQADVHSTHGVRGPCPRADTHTASVYTENMHVHTSHKRGALHTVKPNTHEHTRAHVRKASTSTALATCLACTDSLISSSQQPHEEGTLATPPYHGGNRGTEKLSNLPTHEGGRQQSSARARAFDLYIVRP